MCIRNNVNYIEFIETNEHDIEEWRSTEEGAQSKGI